MIKYLKQKKNFISILVFTLILILILIFFFYFLNRSEPITEDPIREDDPSQAVLIPIEFLSTEELTNLGVDPDTRAQIIGRDPLIYKIIESDEDIIEDIAPFLEPIRE